MFINTSKWAIGIDNKYRFFPFFSQTPLRPPKKMIQSEALHKLSTCLYYCRREEKEGFG